MTMEQAVRPPTLHDKLEGLAALGARVGPDDLLDMLVDVLTVRGWRLGPERRQACAELIWKVTRLASGGGRRQAARRLANLDATPPDLLLALAREPIEIAEPVLRHGRNLKGEHLLQVVSEEGVDHLRVVATRAGLDEAATTLMLLRGDRDALVALLRNPGARIAPPAFGALAQAAAGDAALREAMAGRADLPDTAVDALWPHLDVELKARLVAAGFPREAADRAASAVAWTPGPASGIDPGLALDLLRGAYARGVALLARAAGLDEAAVPRLAAARADADSVRRALADTSLAEARSVLDLLAP